MEKFSPEIIIKTTKNNIWKEIYERSEKGVSLSVKQNPDLALIVEYNILITLWISITAKGKLNDSALQVQRFEEYTNQEMDCEK